MYCLLSAIMALGYKLLFILFVLVFIVLKHLPEDSSSKTADWLLRLEVTLIGHQRALERSCVANFVLHLQSLATCRCHFDALEPYE